MGIEAKHAYRFAFLQSEKWQSVRLEALARDKGICRLCGKEVGSSGDVHHVFYPKSFWKTKVYHLASLCRQCHNYVHEHLPKSFETPRKAFGEFLKLKRSICSDKTNQNKAAKQKAYLENPKCWLCRKHIEGMERCNADHPKLFKFHPFVCSPCSLVINEITKGSEEPFKIMKAARAKKIVDNSGSAVLL